MNAIQVLEQVQRKNYDLAENQILRGTHDPYLLSLIYRLQDKYEAERNLLDAIGPGETANGYFTERKRWLDSPIRQRCESRPPLHLPTSPGSVPSKSTLDQLCFVSAGDSKYFDLLVEMLESLKSTRIYGNTPINLIDCGLSAQEKHYLLGNSHAGGLIS